MSGFPRSPSVQKDEIIGLDPSNPGVAFTAEAARSEPQSANRSRASVELHIEELVLDGFDPAHRYTIGEAVERELARLFTEQGGPIAATHDVAIASLDGGALQTEANSTADDIGARVARAVYGGLGR